MTWPFAILWQQSLSAIARAAARGSAAPIRNAFMSPGSNMALLGRSESFHAFLWFIPFILIALLLLVYVMVKFRDRGDGRQPATFHENNGLELFWTLVPACVVIYVALHSFPVLHFMEFGGNNPDLNVEIIGHQFFWEYKYPAYNIDISNNTLVVPANREVDLDLTSVDVIHGFFVPGLGIQEDALPGQLTNLWFKAKAGYYKGQCDQLCGVNHSLMFIDVQAVPEAQFLRWVQAHQTAPPAAANTAALSQPPALPTANYHPQGRSKQ